MKTCQLGLIRVFVGVVMGAVLACGAACAGLSSTSLWPDAQPSVQGPAGEAPATPRLVRGESGLLFVVGEFDEAPQVGEFVLGRYGGPWPLDQMAPPALWAGVVAEVRSPELVWVHPLHQFPEVDTDQLEVQLVPELTGGTLGKGVAQVEAVDFSGPAHLELSVGGEAGARAGDMYALVEALEAGAPAVQAQLTRRLVGVCMIVDVESDRSTCRLRQGHPQHRWAGTVAAGQQALFLEPSFGAPPTAAKVVVSQTGDEAVDALVMDQLSTYLTRFPGGDVTVEAFDEAVDPSVTEFYRWNRAVEVDQPTILVGVNVEEGRRGQRRLRVNYTGLGPAIGSGMVAAPPQGGVAMGAVDDLGDDDWTGLASVLMGAVLIYRGQNAEALSHLHDALRDPRVSGPWRWHARDQYAMRWAALERLEEAQWLVLEDEAVAQAMGDDQALQNALGTRVRLHHELGQHDQALRAATVFARAYRDQPGSTNDLFAQAMVAEMAAAAGRFDEAREAVADLKEHCPDGCEGDLVYLLAGIYWAADQGDPQLQDQLVKKMVAVTEGDRSALRGAARMFQGWTFMRDDNFEQALIAFLEANRLYEGDSSEYGAARAQFFIAISQGRLGNRQDAFDRGLDTLNYMAEVGDYRATVRIYGQLANLFLTLDPNEPPQRFLGAAPRVMQGHLEARLATGDYAWASEAAFGYGVFMRFAGDVDRARRALQRGVIYGLQGAHLEVVARCHLQLALVARMVGDEEGYYQEMGRAQLIAAAVDDTDLEEEIDSLLSPPEDDGGEPTQFL